jgi:hypothetical protein
MNLISIVEKQWKLIAAVFVLFVVVGSFLGFSSSMTAKKEKVAQESYFLTEKKFLEAKNKKNKPQDKTDAADDKKAAPADYETLKKDFDKVITDFPHSKAAQMSAVYISDILISENNKSLALATLQKVESTDSGLVNTLLQQQIGLLLADQDKCNEALAVWQKILDRKQASFLHNETKIQQALCYKKLNNNKKAEEILTNLANQKSEKNLESTAASKEAEKYLRLIQFKKVSGS